MILLLLACTNKITDDSQVIETGTPTEETGTPTYDTGTITEAQITVTQSECNSPLESVTYTDQSELFFPLDIYDDWALNGPIAMSSGQDDWVAVHIVGTWRTHHWGPAIEPFEIEWPNPIQRVTAVDVNNNQVSDFLVMGEAVDILYDNGVEAVRLIEPAGFKTHREAIALDFCGDDNTDLMVVHASQEEDPGSGGQVFIGSDEGLTGETIAIAPGAPEWGRVFDIMPIDWDSDGDLDLYICNDFGAVAGGNGVLINNGDCSFESGEPRGADIVIDCMGSSTGDLNGDGRLDVFATATGNHHILIDSDGGFYEFNSSISGAGMTGNQMGWGSQVTDYDNDGLNDILVSTSDFTEPDAELYPLQLLRQSNDGNFTEIGETLGLPQETGGRALLSRDLNGDGISDFVVADFMRPPWLFMSDGCTADGWVRVNGPEGTIVKVTTDAGLHTAVVTGGPGFAASMPPQAHIGVGSAQVQRISLTRPMQGINIVDVSANVGAGITINYPE